ncbi:MAG: hypothetical protein PUF12_03045 [Thermoflexaceae bacterium]|nr:hypothetical protein [Thermoflexaceae bacterium]
MNKKILLLIVFMLILVINPKTALSGAVCGLNLWFDVIVPTLLPFMIISYLIQNVYGSTIKNPLLYTTLIGLFCGYPMGAYAVSSMYRQKRISKSAAYLLLACCNISSPAFVISYISLSSLEIDTFPYGILLVNYIPVFLILIYLFITEKVSYTSQTEAVLMPLSFETFDNAMTNSILNILKLGAYIIIFSIFAAFASNFPIRGPILKCLFIGSMEITTGIRYAVNTNLEKDILIPLVLVINAFGGLSCAFQSNTFIKGSDLSIKKYICNKLLLALLTFISWYLLAYVFKIHLG